jgi:hypothetical protein
VLATSPAYVDECGACHMAYQPALLPAKSRQRVFAGLTDHFGDDGSLSDPVRQEIEAYYPANAGEDTGTDLLRITEMRWWLREHHEVKESRWASPEVKFKGNCVACHKAAEQGSYEDD